MSRAKGSGMSAAEIGQEWADREAAAAYPYPQGSWLSTWIAARPLVPAGVDPSDRDDYASDINDAARLHWSNLVDQCAIARKQGGRPRAKVKGGRR